MTISNPGIAPENALKAVGMAQSFESGLRFSVAVVFRLVLGYTAGFPLTAISLNASISLGLGVILEIPAGIFGDVYGTVKSCLLGYFAQALAAGCLFFAVFLFQEHPETLWFFIVAEGVFDAVGNALLSGSREVTYRSIISKASRDLASDVRGNLEEQFLSLSEKYGRIFLVVIPTVTLLAMYYLIEQGGLAGGLNKWLILALGVGWLYLAGNIFFLGRTFEIKGPSRNLKIVGTLREAVDTVRLFSMRQWGVATPFILMTFVFGVVHGFIVVSTLREDIPWFTGNLWFPIVAVNLMFIVGRMLRSFVLPVLASRLRPFSMVAGGSVLVAMLGILVWIVPQVTTTNTFAMCLLFFPLLYDNVHGAATRPALGVLMKSLNDGVAASVLSILAAVTSILAAVFSVWLTISGVGVPSIELIGIVMIAGGCISFGFSYLINESKFDS